MTKKSKDISLGNMTSDIIKGFNKLIQDFNKEGINFKITYGVSLSVEPVPIKEQVIAKTKE